MAAEKAPEHVRRMSHRPDPEKLSADMARLREKALGLGAADAALLRRREFAFLPGPMLVEAPDRSRASAHWPLAFPLDPPADAVKLFSHAVLFRIDTPAGTKDCGQDVIPDEAIRALYVKCYEVTARLESEAFYMGHHLSVGFAWGNCKAVFCPEERRCQATVKGRTCRHPYKARPSMTAAGLDTDAMASRSFRGAKPRDAGAPLYGIVFIA